MRLPAKPRRGRGRRSGREFMRGSGGRWMLANPTLTFRSRAREGREEARVGCSDSLTDRLDQPVALGFPVWARRQRPPDRTRPGRVVAAPRNDVDMELRHHIADGRDVDLVAAGQVL